ncbi:type II toxin-antitoxin system RelE/ParE family toxin [Rhodobacter sp. CCP-1]|uniref:Type II toxin-antitoxin system RelE/ParE family toxin n=2 Tax=Paragemmobacter ruber TaxID=1985673 RepID=A0ABW9YA57_9RHOB|nr:type II toxin-antitoxin system RelE/ParE family toxin [Rhodobacter ruber]
MAAAAALTHAPYQGTRCPELGQNTRRVTKDRAIFYYDLIEDRQVIRLLAIFFGGQDHDARILARLLAPD